MLLEIRHTHIIRDRVKDGKMYVINISHYTRPRCVHSILIVRGSFMIIQEAILSRDSETGWEETTNIAVEIHWLSFVEMSEKV